MSYNSHMTRWNRHRQRSLSERMLLPDPALPASKRCIGILLRAVIVVGVPWIFFKQCSESFLGGERFSALVEEGLRQRFGAEAVEITPFWWHKQNASTERIEVRFGKSHPVASVLLEQVRFSLPIRDRFASTWEIDRLNIRNMEVVMRGASPELPEGAVEAPTWGSLFSIDPQIEKTVVHYTRIKDVDVRWGGEGCNRGGVEGADVTLLPVLGGSGWKIRLAGGTLTQGWLEGIMVETAELEWDVGKLSCGNASLRMPMGGRGEMDFVFESSGLGLDATFELQDTDLRHLLDTYNEGYFSGQVSGTIRMTGTLEAGGQMVSEVSLTSMRDCYCQGIAFFQELGRVTLNPSLGKLPIDAGEFRCRVVGGRLEDILATFTVGNFGLLKFSGSASEQVFEGSLEVGLEEFVLRRMPLLKEEVFSPWREGWWTRRLEVSGLIGQWFSAETEQLWLLSKKAGEIQWPGRREEASNASRVEESGEPPREFRRAKPVGVPLP